MLVFEFVVKEAFSLFLPGGVGFYCLVSFLLVGMLEEQE